MIARKALAAILTALFLSAALTATAPAAVPLAPAWTLSSLAAPTNFKPNDKKGIYFYEVVLENSGGAPTDGSPITLTDTLPTGLAVKSVELILPSTEDSEGNFAPSACKTQKSGQQSTVTCTVTEAIPGAKEPAIVVPSEHLAAVIRVTPGAAGPLLNHAQVQGGGPPTAAAESENDASAQLAPAGFTEWRAAVTDGEGQPVSGAASHPFALTTSFAVNTMPAPAGSLALFLPARGNVKDIEVALPPGLLANPTSAPRCTPHQFTTVHGVVKGLSNHAINECPEDSAIGVISLRQVEGHMGKIGLGGGPIYNLVPPKGMPAQFGFQADGAPIYIDAKLRSGSDYGASAMLRNTSEAKRISAATVTIWGVPAEASHDGLRGSCAELGGLCPAEEEPRPFLRLPSSCEVALAITMSFNTWTEPGIMLSRQASQEAPSGCALPDFSPSLEAQPTTNVADSPSGLHVDLHLPQVENEEDPEGVAEADLRDATVTLPEGLLVNPASADGLASCSTTQIGFEGIKEGQLRFSPEPPACPDASKVGTVDVDTPLIDHPLPGAVYLAKQSDNPFNSLIAIYITVGDPQSGIVVKLPAKVSPDLATGQLTTTATDNPQTPFEDFKLDFFAGDRAPLRTPSACGPAYTTTTDLKPYSFPESGPDRTPSDSFAISAGPAGPCPSGVLAAKLSAGLVNPSAATFSPFTLRLSREDASGEFTALNAATPPGLAAKLAGIPYCPEAAIAQASARSEPGQGALQAAQPSCPPASAVGSTQAGAGAGPSPFFAPGTAYLAGPYEGAPLSLVATIPALAGPFDLGVVVNRIALHLDPETAQVSAISDPFPTTLAGIPLDVREIRVNLSRPDFTLAPTNCEPRSIDATVFGRAGASLGLSERFQVGGCEKLPFKPKLSLRLSGGTSRGDHPALRAVVNYPKAPYANIASTSVALPHSEFLAQEHIRTICTRVQFAAHACPKGSIYGTATATTPLLDEPLKGPVYLRSSSHALPDMVVALHGQVDIELVGRIDSHKGGIRTSFETVPDAPVSKFVLDLPAGAKGLLVNSRDVCAHPARASAQMNGQNGKTYDTRPLLKAPCRAKKPKRR